MSLAICVARSGCVLEMPVSSTPTTTFGLPVVTAWASATSICVISHCWPQSGSPVGLPVACRAVEPTVWSVSSSSSGVPRPSVDATASTPEPEAAVAKSGLVERATRTPICGYAATTVPPAAATRAEALAVELPAGASTR